MKKNLITPITALLLLLTCYVSNGQQGWKWAERANANEVMRIMTDGNGYSYIAGFNNMPDSLYFGTKATYGQIYAVKTDSSGNFLWAAATNELSYGIVFPDIAFDGVGNAYLLASFTDRTSSVGPFTLTNPSPNSACVFLAKISTTGTFEWAKVIGISNSAYLAVDYSGNIYVAGGYFPSITIGSTTLTGLGDYNIYFAKFSASGNVLWAKSMGGTKADEPESIRYSDDGNIYLAGSFITSINIEGQSLTDGTSNSLNPGQFVAKFDTSGKIKWCRNYNNKTLITRLAADNDNFFYMAGNLASTIQLGSDSLINKGGVDGYIAKCDSTGNLIWARSFGGPSDEYNYELTVDACGILWVCGKMGTSTGAYTINFGTTPLSCPSTSNDPSYVAQYDSSGNYLQSFALVSGGDDYMGVSTDHKGNLYVSGDFMGVTIRFGPDSLTLAGLSGEAFFLAKFQYDTFDCYHPVLEPTLAIPENSINLFPNPVFNELTLKTDAPIGSIMITNLVGQIVYENNFPSMEATLNVGYLRPGFYLVKINGTEVRKFLKE
jgi:hypothetical protein